MTTIVERDAALADELRAAVGGHATVVSTVGELESHLARTPAEYAVVLGPSVGRTEAMALAEHNRVDRPAVGLVLVRASVDSDTLAEALRSGMREVVPSGAPEALAAAVDRARAVGEAIGARAFEERPNQPVRGGVVTVFSTKGGVGKSLVATNLAAALADKGKRTCLVDLDVAGGDVAVMLQLSPQHTLADLDQISAGMDASGVRSLLVEQSPNLSVLAAPVQLSAPVPAEPVGALLETLATLFDAVVVDTSGSFDDFALNALDHSDLVLLVGTLDIPALKSLKLATGTLDLLNVPRSRWRVVLNRADSRVGLTVEEFAGTLELPVTVTLATSRDVLASVNRGEVIVRSHRGHQAAKALTTLAAGVAADLTTVGGADGQPASGVHRSRGAARRWSRKAG